VDGLGTHAPGFKIDHVTQEGQKLAGMGHDELIQDDIQTLKFQLHNFHLTSTFEHPVSNYISSLHNNQVCNPQFWKMQGDHSFSKKIFHDQKMKIMTYRHNIFFQINDMRLMNAYQN